MVKQMTCFIWISCYFCEGKYGMTACVIGEFYVCFSNK